MKRTTARLAATAALTATAACTSAASSPDGPEAKKPTASASLAALRAAERATDRADSARVRSSTVMGTQVSLTADGSLSWGEGLCGTLTITYTGGTAAETMRELGVTSMEARYLSDAYYARMGDAFAAKADGKHWLKYAYADLEELGGSAGLADQMRSTTPHQSVKLLLDSDDVHKVAEETVAGQSTTRYSGTVTAADVTDAALRRQLQGAGVTTETVDIWVNEKNLLVKKVENTSTASGRLTQTALYSDYGVQVSVRKPPTADTQDFKALLDQETASPS
ncbi:hypothetical protein AB0L99_23400 [Streptomyces sp. NPDC051954]|uniref:hypothetical protein n=1 Tax=unclassified Streptomyces TaxID=2593676 RepID=UPI0034394C16